MQWFDILDALHPYSSVAIFCHTKSKYKHDDTYFNFVKKNWKSLMPSYLALHFFVNLSPQFHTPLSKLDRHWESFWVWYQDCLFFQHIHTESICNKTFLKIPFLLFPLFTHLTQADCIFSQFFWRVDSGFWHSTIAVVSVGICSSAVDLVFFWWAQRIGHSLDLLNRPEITFRVYRLWKQK